MPADRPGDDVVHAGEKPVPVTDVGQHLEVEIAPQFEAPGTLAGTQAARQPLLLVAVFQVLRVEVGRFMRIQRERDRFAGTWRAVEGRNAYLARLVPVIDHPHESLSSRVGGGREEVHRVGRFPALGGPRSGTGGRRGQVGEVPGRGLQQAHRLNGLFGGDNELPLAGAGAERTVQVRVGAGLQLPCRVPARFARRDGEPHLASRRLAPIVDPGNRHLGDRIAGIDEAQPARLRGVPSRIEMWLAAYLQLPPRKQPHTLRTMTNLLARGIARRDREPLPPPLTLPVVVFAPSVSWAFARAPRGNLTINHRRLWSRKQPGAGSCVS